MNYGHSTFRNSDSNINDFLIKENTTYSFCNHNCIELISQTFTTLQHTQNYWDV